MDVTLEDIVAAAYRLSWPAPQPKAKPSLRRAFGRAVRLCRRQTLEGWPVMLPAHHCN
jgi:hypothetical protein